MNQRQQPHRPDRRSFFPAALGAVLALTLAAGPLSGQAGGAATDTAQQVVDRAIAFHGGDLYTGSETSLTITSRSGSFRVVSRMEGDVFDYTVIDERDGMTRKMHSTNDAVELWQGDEQVPVPPERQQGLRDFVSARVYFPFLPYRLNDPGVSKQHLGREVWEGRELDKIKVTFAAGSSTDAEDEYLYWFDPETGRLEQFAYSFATGNGGLRFRKGFNYRRVGGILFFDSENYGVNGQGRKVDEVTPERVAGEMEKISIVVLEGIEVRPLD